MMRTNEVWRHLHLPFSVHVRQRQQATARFGLFDLGVDVVICRITSALHVGPLDIPVSDWSAAGLEKPSVIRLNRLVTAEKALLRKRLGELNVADREAVRTAWNTHMSL